MDERKPVSGKVTSHFSLEIASPASPHAAEITKLLVAHRSLMIFGKRM